MLPSCIGKALTAAVAECGPAAVASPVASPVAPGPAAAIRQLRTASPRPSPSSSAVTITGPNGQTADKVVASKINTDGTGTRVINVTKPDGTTETRTETFTITPAPKVP